MAWPSGTKASTANVDEGSDSISNARPDIKQNIDNVNLIIDEFNIASPSNGDILRYSTSSGKWEQVAVNTFASTSDIITLANTTYTSISSATPFQVNFSTTVPNTSGISVTTNPGIGQAFWTHGSTGDYTIILHHDTTVTQITGTSKFVLYNGATPISMDNGCDGSASAFCNTRDPSGVAIANYTVTDTSAQYTMRILPGTVGASPSIVVANTYMMIQRH
jgi:hypothetical protein